MTPAPASPTPWLLRWQGLLAQHSAGPLTARLSLVAGMVLCALMAGLPLVTRSGLTLLITAAGLLWLLWALRTPPGRIGAMGGWLLATQRLGFNSAQYLATTQRYLEVDDVVSSLVKAGVFGFFIALMGCYHGYHSGGGAAGVGRATTNAVVSSFILILLSNLIITVIVFGS